MTSASAGSIFRRDWQHGQSTSIVSVERFPMRVFYAESSVQERPQPGQGLRFEINPVPDTHWKLTKQLGVLSESPMRSALAVFPPPGRASRSAAGLWPSL